MKTKGNGENLCKMLNAWPRNCRSILAFMKKGIKDTKRERPEGNCLESSWAVFNGIFMSNKGPSHTLKGCYIFFITFAKNFIIQITWNMILYHWPSPSISYGKFLVLFFFKIFFAPTFFSFFLWFAPDGSLRENSKTLTAPLHLINQF